MSFENTDIAIIGLAGLYPEADDVEVFWQNILAGRDAVTESNDAWLGDGSILEPGAKDSWKIYTRRGGFLGDLSRFDARKFGTMPLSIAGAQPDQFLALKLAHDALVDAGYRPGEFDGSGTGVILGHAVHAHRGNTNGVQQAWGDFQTRNMIETLFPDLPRERADAVIALMQKQLPQLSTEGVPGLVPNIMTGRICNRLDLMGPNYIIDAACSSSLIAVELAADELRAGRADMMLAGGVNTTTSPLVYSVFCSVAALSPDGRIRPFSSEANGTILGEGAGIVALKRLDDALKAGDHIHAVLKATGQSSDGKSSGLMAPRLEGEVLAVRRAYAQSGIDPATIGLVEAHGTGIPLGDKTEIDALRTVFGGREGKVPTIPMGSVKSMIGHCIPASGSAAIIKMCMALTHRTIPPTLVDEPSREIGLENTPFHLATEPRPWIHTLDTPRRAAINAFGFGGINAHMILEESPVGRDPDPTAAFQPRPRAAGAVPERVFAFAAADRAALLSRIDGYEAPAEAAFAEAARESWTAALEDGGPARLALAAASPADLAKKLATARGKIADESTQSLKTRNGVYFEAAPLEGKVAFLFPGEMAQYPGMMRDAAIAFPGVGIWFDFIAKLFAGQREVRLEDVIFPPDTLLDEDGKAVLDTLIHQVDYGSEMVFAADQATFGLLGAMGVKPDAMLGHSTGENAALVASGRLDMDRDGVGRMIARMNEVFAEVETSGVVPRGVLLNVAAFPRDDLEALLAEHPELHFTMDNCPNQTILFGDPERIDAFQRAAVERGAVCTRLPISWGYHTEHVRPMAEAFGALFQDIGMSEDEDGPVLYSCATAKPFPEDREPFGETAISQYTSRVRFTEAVEQMYADGARIFVECGPGAVLSAFVRDILGDKPHLAVASDNPRRGMVAQLGHVAAQLFAAGIDLDPRPLLMPEPDAAAVRRAELRAAHRAAPALPSELPFVRISEAEAAQIREIVMGGQAPAAPGPAPAPAPAAAPVENGASLTHEAPEAAPSVVNGHAMPARRRRLPRPPRPVRPGRGAPQPVASPQIAVTDLAPGFSLPFAFRAYLMQGVPPLAAVLPHLSAIEQQEAQIAAADPSALAEWSLMRLAAKRAARDFLTGPDGQPLADAALPIAVTPAGRGSLDLPGGPGLPGIALSEAGQSERGRAGIGAAAAPGWSIGIDLERPARIRDPRGLLAAITGPEEAASLALPPSRETAALIWSAKEAAARAMGLPFEGRARDFILRMTDPASGSAVVEYRDPEGTRGPSAAQTQIRRLQDAICTVAWIPSIGGSTAEMTYQPTIRP